MGTKARETWARLTLNQKILFAGAAVLLLAAGAYLLIGSSSQGNYEVLYSGLDTKAASAVVKKLDEDKISYQLQDNGTTILVPPDVKYSTRLKLAGENLPSGESGFELFQQSNFGETQTDKQVKYQVALQGELARTIESLEKVKAARVHLVIPEESLYSEKEQKPTASVAITTAEEQRLTPREIQGIINLISNSVEGLNPENVVIIDQNGKLISENLEDTESATEQLKNQMEIKKQFEKEKQQAIQTMLDKSLGQDNAVVRVSAELNFDSKEDKSIIHTHDPEGPFVVSEHIVKDSGTNTETNPAGVPGTDTNIPQYTEVNTTTGTSTYDKSDKSVNYDLNTTETQTRYAPGEAKYDYLTVAVVVNNTAVSKLNLGQTEEERVEKIRNIVATACGLRENRQGETVNLKDNISVAFMDFYTPPLNAPAVTGLKAFMQSPWAPALMVLLILVTAVLVWLLMRRKARKAREAEELARLAAEAEAEPGFEAIVEEELSIEDLIDKKLTPEERKKQRIKQEVEKLVDENPENAAQVLKTWLLEDQR
jgi:flagellar M-ring protein FliF